MKKSIFIIAWSYLKRRKWQSLLVGISIALSALLFATTLGLLQGMNRPFDMMYDQLKASHLLLMYDYREADSEQIQNWFKTQPEVVAVGNAMPFVSLGSPIIYHNQELDLNVNLTERPLDQPDLDQVFFLQGNEASYPKMGEIWLPDHLVRAHGIQIGDTVGIPTPEGLYPLVVSTSLVDPQYASGLFNPTRAWVAPGSLSFMFSISQLSQRMLGIRFEDPANIQNVWQRFHQENYFTGKSLEYGLFKSVFLSFYQIIQMILLVFSILGIIISLFVLSTTLSGAIIGDLKLIGLYKATGFTPGNIIQIYLFQYLILGIMSLPLGLLGSYGLTRAILNQILHSVGLTNLNISFSGPMGITTLIFLALIGLIAWRGSRKAARVNAVSAIRSDPSTSQNAISTPTKIWSLNWLKVPVIWGMVMLLSNPKRTIYTGLSMVMAIFILLFSINVSHSFAGLKDQKAAWGLEDSDIQVKRNEKIALPLEHETMLDLLSEESAVEVVVPYAYVSAIIPALDQKAPQDILGKVYTSNLNAVGLFNLSGLHPASADEIALCVMTAQEQQKQVGDSIHLFIEGQHRQYLITGIYQDVSNLGKGFRLSGPAMETLNPLFKPEFYALKLKPEIEIETFQHHLQATYGETMIIEQSVEDRKGIRNTIASMQGALTAIGVFFLLILFAILFNDTLMNIRDYRRSLGILKTVGMTAAQLRWGQIYKFSILTIFCLVIGIPLGMGLSPSLISQLTQGIGLVEFPFVLDWSGTMLLIPGMLVFTGLSAWWASGRLAREWARELIGV